MSKSALHDALRAYDNNQTELAKRLGLKSRQHVNNWVNRAKVNPDWRVPRKYREAVLAIAKEVRK